MGFGKKAMAFLFMVVVMCVEVAMGGGVVYKVGDSAGWTNVAHVNYGDWSHNKTFNVGDTIVFQYYREFHNVLRVTHQNFRDCNTTAPYATFNSGNDSFTIGRAGHYYFICGIPGHCQAGQKVDIRVPKSLSPAPAPTPIPTNPPPSPFAPVVPSTSPGLAPAPSPSHHKKSGSSIVMVNKILLSLVVLAFCV